MGPRSIPSLCKIRISRSIQQTWRHREHIRDIVEANRAEIFDGKATAYVVGLFKQYLLEADGLDPETAGGSDPDPSTNRLQARRERQLSGARSVRASARQQGGAGRPAKDDPDADRHWNYFEEQERREEARRG